jgi:methylenetetrahydrofolate dehydrogenase (NADP+)/methenyltetrahydrofolate cyclohydrolase
MAIIDGKAMSEKIRAEIKAKIAKLPRKPGLATVLVGENPASKVYVNMKNIACEKAGLHNEKILLDKEVSEEELIETIENLNSDPKIDGILVQLPLPKHINENKVLQVVNPYKDVDGFHPVSLGHLMSGNNTFVPCTPKGCMKLIESVTKIEGKNAVVVGRSNIVGKPIAQLLLQKNATVTICHSKTKDLPKVCKEADILVVAVGRPKLVTKDMVKKGAVVIDVGINRVEDKSEKGYHIEGDVDFENVKDIAAHITPVPKGVGPMTIAMLLENTLEACIRKLEDK